MDHRRSSTMAEVDPAKGVGVPRKRLSEDIVRGFLRRIGDGELRPGDSLPSEATLAESLNVGRSVMREALQALAAKGFILLRQGSSTVVSPRHRWHVLDPDFVEVVTNPADYFPLLHEARAVIEPRLAALAATRATDDQLAELAAAHERMRHTVSPPEAHAELDIAFHDAIARAARNAILVSVLDSLSALGRRSRITAAEDASSIQRAIEWHDKILAAVTAREPDLAASAMTLHLHQVEDDLRRTTDGSADAERAAV